MVRMTWKGGVVFVSPTGVRVIRHDTYNTPAVSVVEYEDAQTVLVDGTPDEVHAALFPPTAIIPTKEQNERIREAMARQRAQAMGGGVDPQFWVPVDMIEPAKEFRSELSEALNPATYQQEWENHSPNCARAMAWALGLVRARLGVGE